MAEDRHHAGFALAEMLVALSLLALLAGYAFLALGQMSGLREVEARIARESEIAAVLGHLRQALEGAVPVLVEDAGGERRMAFVGEPDRLLLATPGEPRLEAGGLHLVEYIAETTPGGSWLVTRRRLYRGSLDGEAADVQELRLLGDIARLSFRYFGAPAAGEPEIWSDRWPRPDALPRLIEIDLTDPGTGLPPLLVLLPSG